MEETGVEPIEWKGGRHPSNDRDTREPTPGDLGREGGDEHFTVPVASKRRTVVRVR